MNGNFHDGPAIVPLFHTYLTTAVSECRFQANRVVEVYTDIDRTQRGAKRA